MVKIIFNESIRFKLLLYAINMDLPKVENTRIFDLQMS